MTTTIYSLAELLDIAEREIEILNAIIKDDSQTEFVTHDFEREFNTDRGRKAYVDSYWGHIKYADNHEQVCEHEEEGEEPENPLYGSDAHVLSTEPLVSNENVWEFIHEEFINGFIAEVGYPFEAVLSYGKSYISIIAEGYSNFRLEGYWGSDCQIRTSPTISSFMEALIDFYTEGLYR